MTQHNPSERSAMRCPRFVEWMQGLPAGWVTDVPGLTRAQQLSMLGDGVVPQWAVAVFSELVGRFAWNTERAA
jgi:DNA (cytosine-5)-methyltransferase 1